LPHVTPKNRLSPGKFRMTPALSSVVAFAASIGQNRSA
jgi:hypothetical protein